MGLFKVTVITLCLKDSQRLEQTGCLLPFWVGRKKLIIYFLPLLNRLNLKPLRRVRDEPLELNVGGPLLQLPPSTKELILGVVFIYF